MLARVVLCYLPGREREPVGLADLVCQVANGCRRIPKSVPGVLASRELFSRTLFGPFESGHQIIAIRSFAAVPHIVGTYLPEEPLYLASLLIPIMVLHVEKQPEFKAWIGVGDINAPVFA